MFNSNHLHTGSSPPVNYRLLVKYSVLLIIYFPQCLAQYFAHSLMNTGMNERLHTGFIT